MLLNRDGYGPDGRRLYFFDLGGDSSPPPPDYTPLANSSKESAQIMATLGEKQLAESQRQYDANSGIAKQVVGAQLDIMQQTADQGKEYYDYAKSTFRPVEEGLVKDAADFSTAGAKEQFARSAAADLEGQQANEQAQSDRAMAAMGVNPNSGRFAGMKRAQTILNSGARAGATSSARVQADNLAFAKRMDVAGLGRNLPGASVAAYGAATGAGNSAVGNQMAPGGQLLSGMAQGANITGAGLSIQNQGLSAIAGAQGGDYRARLSADATQFGSMLSGLGAIGTGVGALAVFSSKKLKTDKRPADQALNGVRNLNIGKWKYKKGVADGGEHVGPYAEDVHKEFGNKVAPGGKMIDMISMQGVMLKAIQELDGKVASLAGKRGRTIDGKARRVA